MPNLTPRQARTGVLAFLALCFAVMTNILLLQDGPLNARHLQPELGIGSESLPRHPIGRKSGRGEAAHPGRWKTRVRTKAPEGAGRGASRSRRSVAPSVIGWSPTKRQLVSPKSSLRTGALTPAQPQTVRAIQRELAARGYQAGQVDGVTGLMTRAAVMAFEYDQGLELTAVPTQTLLRQILLGQRPAGPVGRGLRTKYNRHARRVIQSVQRSLSNLGYIRAPQRGLLSEATERAIREFEMDHGLIATGRISGQLVAALGRASRGVAGPRAGKK